MRMSSKEYKETFKKKNKFNAKKTKIDGIIFDSMAEAEFYCYLKNQKGVLHIDCHLPVTLPGGVRFSVDFIVWWPHKAPEAFEVKGFITQSFGIQRRLFDSFHPLAPLKVIRKIKNKWENI